MKNNDIVLYGIGGLGADHRVFNFLSLDLELIPIIWIKPIEGESLSVYAKRISIQIDKKMKFGLVGVSFGGMLVIELNKLVNPEFTILISSASKSSELPAIKSIFKRLKILPFLPNAILKPPFVIMKYLFGAQNSKLLKEIIHDTSPEFIRWALDEIITWESDINVNNLYQIHGSCDRLIPIKNKPSIIVKEGGHFMIVDKASLMSKHINKISSQYQKN